MEPIPNPELTYDRRELKSAQSFVPMGAKYFNPLEALIALFKAAKGAEEAGDDKTARDYDTASQQIIGKYGKLIEPDWLEDPEDHTDHL